MIVRIAALVCLFALASAACDGSSSTPSSDAGHAADAPGDALAGRTGPATDTGPSPDGSQPDGSASDGSEPDPVEVETGPCGEVGTRHLSVLQVLHFATEDEPGIASGLDLDGRVSDDTDAHGCFHPDLVSSSGLDGVDNQFAKLLPTLDSLGGDPVDSTVQAAINDGKLLLLFEIDSVDDWHDDDCIGFTVFRGLGEPLIGTDALVLPGQSFDIDLEQPWFRADSARIVDGVIEAGPFPLVLPLQFFATELTIDFSAVWVRFTLESDGRFEGEMGAVAPLDKLLLAILNTDPGFAPIAEPLLADLADLDPDDDGACQSISIGFDIRGARAHLYEDAERP